MYPTNPDGSEYSPTLKLYTVKDYTYCVVVKYTADGGFLQTYRTSVTVKPCDD